MYGGGNPVLLQEEEVNLAGETNNDADVNTEANRINDKKKNMAVTMKENKKTLGYQETINVDIEKLPVKNNHFGDQYMKLVMIRFLKKQFFFQ